MRWMNLEPIIQSEVTQKEKNKDRILTHVILISTSRTNDGTNEPICRAAMETQTMRTDLWTQRGEEGEGGMYGENNIYSNICITWVYILTYVK